MFSLLKKHKFIEENISISSGNQPDQDNNKNKNKIAIMRKDNKGGLIIDLSSKKKEKLEEDDNSQQILSDDNNFKIKAKSERLRPFFNSKRALEKYTARMKERTMRLEIEKINKETERFKKEYEEKNSYNYLFDNNPQFQRMLKKIQIQLSLILLIAIIIFILNSILYFNVTKKKSGLTLVNAILSLVEIILFFILFIFLKIRLLNDPYLSKAFRLFILIEFSLHFATFILNILLLFLIYGSLHKVSTGKIVIIYIYFILIILLTIFSFKFCYILFLESFLILLNKKTEYAILMIREQNNNPNGSNNNNNLNNLNLSISKNDSSIGLETESNLIIGNENKIKNKKDDEKYRNYHYFNRFHYSVTSDRKEPNYFK